VSAPAERLEQQIAALLQRADVSDPAAFWGLQFDLGLAWVHFPTGMGGLDLPRELQSVVDRRLSEAGTPANRYLNLVGLEFAAPTLVAHGTPEQRERYLRPIFTCEEVWCQLFSEPGAGSDLASLATRAVPEGSGWMVNGQKVWTSFAAQSQLALLLARTDPDVPKHKGLTYFIVDMRSPGVDVRPLRQMTGEREFNEVHLDHVRLAGDQRLGALGSGWQVAITTLMNERRSWADADVPRETRLIREAVRVWRERGHDDPVRRDLLMKLWVRAEASRLNSARSRIDARGAAPGPEGSIAKMVSAELNKAITSFALDLLEADGLLYSGYDKPPPERSAGPYSGSDVARMFLRTRANSIEAGSTEINKNIIAERILGLPGDIKVDSGKPWRELRRS
jgi:alkylation response protein AidB-like acyl-CoA dehydrogenase